MTSDGGTAHQAVDLADQSPHNELAASDDLALVRWFADHFDQRFSPSSLDARMPRGYKLNDLEVIARAFSAIGLKSRMVTRSPPRIDPMVLPCVLLRKTGGAIILNEIDRRKGNAIVIDPHEGGIEREIKLRQLRRQVQSQVLFVTKADDLSESRFSPEIAKPEQRRSHWFWSAVRDCRRSWIQVLLAALCLNLLNLALPLFVMNVYDKVIPNLAFVTLWTLAIGVIIALSLDLVLRLLRAGLIEHIGQRVDLTVASRLFAHAMNVKLLNRPGGAAGIAGTIRDFDTVREFFSSATFVSLIDVLFIGIFIALLFWIVGPLAFVPLAALPVVFTLALITQVPLGKTAERAQQMATKRHIVLVETLSGIETIKSVNAEPVMQREWEKAVADASRVNGRMRIWSGFAANSTILIQQVVSVTIIVWGVFLVSEGQVSIGGLIAANILAGRVLAPLGMIAQTILRAQYATKSLRALNSFMKLPVDQAQSISHDIKVKRGQVELKNVTLTYPAAHVSALNNLNFKASPGEVVALLGRVGSGKTTMGKVISGLISPDSGTVLVDGIAINQYEPAELRAGVGYLPQNPELFTGTLQENVVIGVNHASDSEVMRALYFAAMDEFVSEHPDGMDLFIGERGDRLSGGQRQGISLARLILRRPKMLFLDEPTNAMDQTMEARLVSRLGELQKAGTGVIVSTHRHSLTAMASRLVVIDQGRVVLDGPREEVMAQLLMPKHEQAGAGDVR